MLQLSQILPVGSPSSCLLFSCAMPPSFNFFFFFFYFCRSCFLSGKTVLSSLVLLSHSWNQPFLLGAWFLILGYDIKDQGPGASCAQYFCALPAGHVFFDSFLAWVRDGPTWPSKVSFSLKYLFLEGKQNWYFPKGLRMGTLKICCVLSEFMLYGPAVLGTYC